jgi:hypothetical protein
MEPLSARQLRALPNSDARLPKCGESTPTQEPSLPRVPFFPLRDLSNQTFLLWDLTNYRSSMSSSEIRLLSDTKLFQAKRDPPLSLELGM